MRNLFVTAACSAGFAFGLLLLLFAGSDAECSPAEPELFIAEECPAEVLEVAAPGSPLVEGWALRTSCHVDDYALASLQKIPVFESVERLSPHFLLITTKCCYGDIRGDISHLFPAVKWGESQ